MRFKGMKNQELKIEFCDIGCMRLVSGVNSMKFLFHREPVASNEGAILDTIQYIGNCNHYSRNYFS
jgi:hypothetical protein